MGHGTDASVHTDGSVPLPSVAVIIFGADTPHTCIAWGPGGPANPANHSWRWCRGRLQGVKLQQVTKWDVRGVV